ncbi:MAG: hypothetical protein AB7M93_01655 [Candidatus Obscuribacterales bacterium]
MTLNKRVPTTTEAQLKDFAKTLGFKKVVVDQERGLFQEEPKILDFDYKTVRIPADE